MIVVVLGMCLWGLVALGVVDLDDNSYKSGESVPSWSSTSVHGWSLKSGWRKVGTVYTSPFGDKWLMTVDDD
jgi:hypothetical protein